MRILVAEDEAELAKGLQFLLEKNKFTVDIVYDGAEVLFYFRCRDYDVVILDIMIPNLNGLEVLRQIREAGSGVPVLMLTAKEYTQDVLSKSRKKGYYKDYRYLVSRNEKGISVLFSRRATSADIAAMEHEGDEWIENIRRQAARLTKLVGDMVALSRLDEESPFPEKSRW